MKTPFLKEVAEDLIRRFGEDLSQLAIIFNNKRPEVYLKKYLSEILRKPIWSPSFFTIQDFFKKGSSLIEADRISQIIQLHDCYVQLLQKKQQEPLSIDRFFPIAETILSDFAQIDYDLIDPLSLYQEVGNLAEIEKQFQFLTPEQVSFLESFWKSYNQYGQLQIREKFIQLWRIMPLLYQNFHQALEEQGKATTAMLYRLAASVNTYSTSLVSPYKKTIFVGFNALNRAEGTLFKRWQEEQRALFYFDADPYYLDDPLQEAGLFIRKNSTFWKLENALGPFSDAFSQQREPINLIEATGFTAQAKILDTLLAQKTDQDSIAILLADEALLVPTLQSIPEKLSINITMGFPIHQSPLYGWIDLWLETQLHYLASADDHIPYHSVEHYLAHPLSDFLPADKTEIQRLIRAHHYLLVPYAAIQPFAGPDSFFKRAYDALSLIKMLELLLKALFQKRKDQEELTLIEASLVTAVLQELNHLYDNIQAHRSLQEADLSFMISMIRKHIQHITAAIEGNPLQGIQVMGLLESRNLDFKELYILGANDGVLPKRSFGNTFIPDSIRRAYGLPVLENQEALSAYLFYRLLQRPEQITIIYNNQVDERSTGEVSRFIKQLAFESPLQFTTLKQQQETKANQAVSPLIIPKTGKVAQVLDQYLDGGPLKLSATALTNYIQSPLLFFFKNIAHIREPEPIVEDFQINKIGTILHEVMQWFYEELRRENPWITKDRIEKKMSDLPALCIQALSSTFYHDPLFLVPDKLSSIEKIMLQIVEDYATLLLQTDLANTPFEIIELENKEDYAVDFPISVNGRETRVNLQGVIDRIDRIGDTIRIVDYKTGGDVLEYTRNEEDLFSADDPKFNKALIQTLFYTYIYEQKSGLSEVEPHLYTVRKIKEEGSLFHSNKHVLQGEKLRHLKVLFLGKLRTLIEELFNPEIPFQHPADRILPYHDLYQEFFNGSSSYNSP